MSEFEATLPSCTQRQAILDMLLNAPKRYHIRGSYVPDESDPSLGYALLAGEYGTMICRLLDVHTLEGCGDESELDESDPYIEAFDLYEKTTSTDLLHRETPDPPSSPETLRLDSPEFDGAFIAAQLLRSGLDPRDRNELVLAAESVQFEEPHVRDSVAEALFKVIKELKSSCDTASSPVVWSAIRTYATLIPAENASRLLSFVQSGPGVDTRLVTLQAIGTVFETYPPEAAEQFRVIGDCAFSFAEKCLDPFVFMAGEIGAIAINSVVALAAVGDLRVPEVVAQAKRLERNWLNRQLRNKLRDLLQRWQSNGAQRQPPYLRLAEAISCMPERA